jgi:hypothetical protein
LVEGSLQSTKEAWGSGVAYTFCTVCLASTAGSSFIEDILPQDLSIFLDVHFQQWVLPQWQSNHIEVAPEACSSQLLSLAACGILQSTFQSTKANAYPQTSTQGARREECGVWPTFPLLPSVGLRIDYDSIRFAVGL